MDVSHVQHRCPTQKGQMSKPIAVSVKRRQHKAAVSFDDDTTKPVKREEKKITTVRFAQAHTAHSHIARRT